mgnify:CR=1 FL=1
MPDQIGDAELQLRAQQLISNLGGIRKAAKVLDLSPTFICQVDSGKSKPGTKIAAYLGYEKVTVWRKKEDESK